MKFLYNEAMTTGVFVTDEKRVWMRLRDHVVIFEHEPDFGRFLGDPGGPVLRILRIRIADPDADLSRARFYIGSVRRCECGGWTSRYELMRLFRRATVTAHLLGENAEYFRAKLSGFLRQYFG